jgi:DNA-binding NtrC family response regulator
VVQYRKERLIELFCNEKALYRTTGTREGYFEVANGGTIFLDEVGELPLTTQVRLRTGKWRIYKSRFFTSSKTDVRIVAATNVNLFDAIEKENSEKICITV